uniref:SLC9A3 regulator 2 n=1 Tax=Anas platyrhynchos TaxID=8839 RepID=A0A8B9ZK73_ANAPL
MPPKSSASPRSQGCCRVGTAGRAASCPLCTQQLRLRGSAPASLPCRGGLHGAGGLRGGCGAGLGCGAPALAPRGSRSLQPGGSVLSRGWGQGGPEQSPGGSAQPPAAPGEPLKPRLCHMLKGENGYGFHLHGEKGKSGQFIRKVEPGSPAEAAGLRAGDRVVEVNGLNVEQETHHQVVQRIKAVETETRLLVVDKETDEYLCSLRLTCTEEMVHSGVLLAPWEPPCPWEADLNGQKELCPRLCHLKKGPNGYGFNLHSEKSQPGQFIRSVDPDSPASRAGLRPQDRLVEVNGINVEGLRHSEVVSHIKARESEARLLVVDPETDDYFKKLGVTPTEEHTKGETRLCWLNGGSTSSSHSDLQSPGKESEDGDSEKRDPFEESGAPQMDWNKKREIFSNF